MSTALMIPTVAVGWLLISNNPKGLPRAITHSPIIRSSEFDKDAYGKSRPSNFNSATSDIWSIPIISAENSLPPCNDTNTSLAFSTTWEFVIT